MSIVIISRPRFFGWHKYLELAKSLLRQKRGPQRVTQSLIKGLKELNIFFKLNPSLKQIAIDDIIYVNESIVALREAIELKKNGKCACLIAGPAITVLPEDNSSLMMNKNIDVILQPAEWVKSMWQNQAPEIQDKIKVWWAGVDKVNTREDKKLKKNDLLLYIKDAPAELVEQIKSFLANKKISYRILEYGHYSQENYFEILHEVKGMIFLSKSESQGLALCEAWMRDVPTLVWSPGVWSYKQVIWKDEKISAPYLNDKNGMFFKSTDDFVIVVEEFLKKISEFTPREDALRKFTHKICAQNFLNLIKQK